MQRVLRIYHLAMTIVWAVAIIPTMLWWSDSILWVALLSVYANLAGEFAGYQASRVEKKQEEGGG